MKSWWIVALVSLGIVNASEHLQGQTRGSGGSQSHGPSHRPAGAALRAGSQTKPSGPFLPLTNQGRSTIPFVPVPFGGRHTRFPARSSWFGLMAFDSSWLWAPNAVDGTFVLPSAPPPQQRPVGGLQLDVEPRRALVYVDGWYAGVVDDFSGYYRHLETGAGWHIIEILAPDYQPLIFDVAVSPGRTTTYRNSLNRAPSRY
jgi:hypothetical protein